MKSHRLHRRLCAVLSLCLAALLAGCTDDNAGDPPPVTIQPQQAGGAPPKPRGAEAPQPTARPRQQSAARPKAPPIDPEADPEDVFEIVSSEPLFDIVGQAPRVKPADQFIAVAPPTGSNADSFVVVSTVRSQESSGPANPDFKLPSGFRALPSQGYSPAGLPLRITCEADKALMALVPAGISPQGTNNGPPEAGPEFPVYLDAYYIDVTETTVGQFIVYRDDQRSKGRSITSALNENDPPEYPVQGVSWGTAQAYSRWAGKDLPTEAEWERAARGEAGFKYPWGNSRVVWPRSRTLEQIDPVGTFATDKSAYGVYDLAGNVREWCADWYSADAYKEASSGPETVVRNWTGPRKTSELNERVVKGNGPDWACWHRRGVEMRTRLPGFGFRSVLRVKQPGADGGK